MRVTIRIGAGALGFLGVLPSVRRVRELIEHELNKEE
jgi:hypothetical protein